MSRRIAVRARWISSARAVSAASGSASTGRLRICATRVALGRTQLRSAWALRRRRSSTSACSAAVSGTTFLAASVGVAARRSATRSHSGLSGSWPTALITGVRARGDRAAQRLVGERQQILDAAAAAGDHDDVDFGVAIEFAQRLDDLRDGVGPLHRGVADREPHRGPARAPPSSRRVRRRWPAGDQPDHVGQERDRPLEPRSRTGPRRPAAGAAVDAGQQLAHPDSANLADAATRMCRARCRRWACRSTTTWVPSATSPARSTSSRGQVMVSDMSAAGSRSTMNTVWSPAACSAGRSGPRPRPCRACRSTGDPDRHRAYREGFSADWPSGSASHFADARVILLASSVWNGARALVASS